MKIKEINKLFAFEHLPGTLQMLSSKFHVMAHDLHKTLPSNSQSDVMYQKLLEAKDAAVRAMLLGVHNED